MQFTTFESPCFKFAGVHQTMHSPTLAVQCMEMLLFLLYYAALLSLSARQAEPVDFKA